MNLKLINDINLVYDYFAQMALRLGLKPLIRQYPKIIRPLSVIRTRTLTQITPKPPRITNPLQPSFSKTIIIQQPKTSVPKRHFGGDPDWLPFVAFMAFACVIATILPYIAGGIIAIFVVAFGLGRVSKKKKKN